MERRRIMKKRLALVLAGLMTLGLIGCGKVNSFAVTTAIHHSCRNESHCYYHHFAQHLFTFVG